MRKELASTGQRKISIRARVEQIAAGKLKDALCNIAILHRGRDERWSISTMIRLIHLAEVL